MWGHDKVTLRDYVDKSVEDLTKYHDTTVQSIQDELDRRLGEFQREIAGRFREQATAVDAASAALSKRLDGMNEFRDSIRDVTANKVDTSLFDQTITSLTGRIEQAEKALERQRGRMGAYVAVGTIFLVLIGLLTLVINHIRL